MGEHHKLLVQKLSELEQYNDSQGRPLFRKHENIMVKDIKKIDPHTVHYSGILLANLHNVSGSAAGWQLYDLLKVYFGDEDKREKINAILNT